MIRSAQIILMIRFQRSVLRILFKISSMLMPLPVQLLIKAFIRCLILVLLFTLNIKQLLSHTIVFPWTFLLIYLKVSKSHAYDVDLTTNISFHTTRFIFHNPASKGQTKDLIRPSLVLCDRSLTKFVSLAVCFHLKVQSSLFTTL